MGGFYCWGVFMSVQDCHDLIMKICEENNLTTGEEMNAFFYNKDGTMREELSKMLKEAMHKNLSETSVNCVPVDLSDFSKLSDAEIYDEMSSLVFAVDDLNEIQQIALVAYEFEMEFANGGVSQYFGNTRGEHIDELCSCLRKIGAEKYAEKCEEFINKYNIKASNFSGDESDYDFEKVESMYPYEELEDAIMTFYYDDPLSKYIVDYVRANEEDFRVSE